MSTLHFLSTLTKHMLLIFIACFMAGSSIAKARVNKPAFAERFDKRGAKKHRGRSVSKMKQMDHEDDDERSHDEGLKLTDEQKKEIGFRVEKAGSGSLQNEFSLMGEIVLNQDNVTHLVPKTPGIVSKVMHTLGDMVKKGEVLAILESAELGKSKTEYYEYYNEVGCCKIDLDRARTIAANTEKLLKYLNGNPTLDQLGKITFGDMGEYRSRLLSSYTELVVAQKAYAREKNLFEDKISSENDYLEARNAFEKAQAEYHTELDKSRFEIKQKLLEQERSQRVAKFKLLSAERRLRILGLDNHGIEDLNKAALRTVLKTASETTTEPHQCTDPNCKSCASDGGKHDNHHDIKELNKTTTEAHQCTDPNCKSCASEGGKHDDHHDIKELNKTTTEPHQCTDPNCKSCASEGGKHYDHHDIKELNKTTTEAHQCTDPNCQSCESEGDKHDDHHDVKKLNKTTTEAHQCTDPNCQSCESEGDKHDDHHDHAEENLTKAVVTAPQSGTIIEKHISKGERVGDDSNIFTIADLSTVWADLRISARDVNLVRRGMQVVIESPNGYKATAAITLIGPSIDKETRTALARVALDNHDGNWKPGTFVTGHVRISANDVSVVVPHIAVQSIEGKDVVFVQDGHGFKPLPVVTDRRDRNNVEIIIRTQAWHTLCDSWGV